MPQYTIGQRVGALMGADGDTVRVFGYGTYQGDQIPPAELKVQMWGVPMDRPNPCIKLDNGKLVFGCECWWGPEELIKERVKQYSKIVNVDIAAERAKYNKKAENETQG